MLALGERQCLVTIAGDIDNQANGLQQIDRHFLIDRIVLGQQYSATRHELRQAILAAAGAQPRLVIQRRLKERGESECAALVRYAVDADFTLHRFGQPAADCQPESGAAITPRR